MKTVSFIGIGSNMKQPILQVKRAITEISKLPKTKLLAQSSLYSTSPHGPIAQNNFVNAVVSIETSLAPETLLNQLLAIEQKHHRIRNNRWGPRTLDLDILSYGQETIHKKQLSIPHPLLIQRLFMLIPLQEIAPKFRLANGKKVAEQILLLQADNGKEEVTRLMEGDVHYVVSENA